MLETVQGDDFQSLRSVAELEENALKFWPKAIALAQTNASVIPLLLQTQEKFIRLSNSELRKGLFRREASQMVFYRYFNSRHYAKR